MSKVRFFSKKFFKESLYQNLIKNVGILFGGNIVASLLGLLSLAITSHALGAENLGLLVLAQTYITIIDRLINFQSWQALIKFGSEALNKKNMDEFNGLIKSSTLIDAGSAIAGTTIALSIVHLVGAFLEWEPVTRQMCMVFSIVIPFHLAGTPTAILRLFGKFKLLAIHQVIASAFKFTAILIAYLLDQGIWVYLYIWIATDVINHILLFTMGHITLYRQQVTGWYKATQTNFYRLFRFTFWTNITSTFDLPVKQFDILLVSSLISLEATGIYRVIKQVGSIIVKIADPVYQAIFPDFTRQIAEGQTEKAMLYAFRVGGGLFLVISPFALTVALTGSFWVPLVFGSSFSKGVSPMALFIMLKAISIGFITLHPLFVAIGYVKQNAAIIFVTNIVYIIVAFVLGRAFGLTGVVLAYAVPMLLTVLTKLIILKKHQTKLK